MKSEIGPVLQMKSHVCEAILYLEIGSSRVRMWDLIILLPNLIFLLFLIARFKRTVLKLRATNSPIFIAFYGLVVGNVILGIARSAIFILISLLAEKETPISVIDKLLWVVVKFFLLATEMSVVIFCLAFGHLDSRSSIKYVLLATSLVSLAFSITQGCLEIMSPDERFRDPENHVNIFGHGGLLFWFTSSALFAVIYLFVFVLPWTSLRHRLVLPTKHTFYVYIFVLIFLYAAQTIGSGLLNYAALIPGLCVLDITSCLYFTLYTPFVYYSFLSEFFSISHASIMFSYKAQMDDVVDDDNVSLPHQQSFSSLKTDSDYIYQSQHIYDNTPFEQRAPTLYVASLQSPDSIDSSAGSIDGYQQS